MPTHRSTPGCSTATRAAELRARPAAQDLRARRARRVDVNGQPLGAGDAVGLDARAERLADRRRRDAEVLVFDLALNCFSTSSTTKGYNHVASLCRTTLALVGRILLALIFIMSGFEQDRRLRRHRRLHRARRDCRWRHVLAVLTIAASSSAAGLALLAGFLTRWSAPRWRRSRCLPRHLPRFLGRASRAGHDAGHQFMKNLAVAGGMLALAAFGAGAGASRERGLRQRWCACSSPPAANGAARSR